tara:strand:- start:11353 stop:11487 length:135 start_codon:yes stop_codon:yes gene_type:complete
MTDPVKIEKEQVRQGETSGRMRKVVVCSTVLSIAVISAAVYFSA